MSEEQGPIREGWPLLFRVFPNGTFWMAWCNKQANTPTVGICSKIPSISTSQVSVVRCRADVTLNR